MRNGMWKKVKYVNYGRVNTVRSRSPRRISFDRCAYNIDTKIFNIQIVSIYSVPIL